MHWLQGPLRAPRVDLLLLHVDLTIVPDDYLRFVDAHPCVVNRRVRDISKRRISRQLVQPGDDYSGPVIVKSDLNCQGDPERRIANRRRRARLGPFARKQRQRTGYRIFASARDLPPGIRADPSLVVERFLPERSGDLYCLRSYLFAGDFGWCSLRTSRDPIVKSRSTLSRSVCEVDAAIVAERQRLGFDYGKFDYVLHEGRPVLLDVNRTPSYPDAVVTATRSERAARYAEGLLARYPQGYARAAAESP